MITTQARWSEIQQEISGCSLLCENCHRELHASKSNLRDKATINKQLCLEFKGHFRCSICGYDRCSWALEFHHNDEKTQGITKYIINYKWNNVGDLQQWVIEELNKCNVYCANCHKEKHFDSARFDEFSNEIMQKIHNMVEKNPPVDKGRVIDLNGKGLTILEISKLMKCSYRRVYEILKTYGLHRPSVDKQKAILKMWRQGKSAHDISKIIGCSRQCVAGIIRTNNK
jgi:hypothetical protein